MIPRGIRNNNPGNIRLGDPWQGLSKTQNDPDFCQFVAPVYGIRAIAKILSTYQLRGYNTTESIISHWAPSNENNTQAYVNSVANYCGITSDTPLNFKENKQLLIKFIEGIIVHENGKQPYSLVTVEQGISLAGF